MRRCTSSSVYTADMLPGGRRPLSLFADRCKSMAQLKQVHAQMVVTARIQDNYAASRILSFAASGDNADICYALRLFQATQQPNSFMWNTIIHALADSPYPSNALHFTIRMLRQSPYSTSPPGRHTFTFALKACNNCGALSTYEQLHGHVSKRGLQSDLYIINGLIRCYSGGGLLFEARMLFDEMTERNQVVWTTMVSSYAQNLQSNDALSLFHDMMNQGVEPNDATLASVLSVCARSGCLELGEQIESMVEEKGIERSVILNTAFVDMYAKNGAIDKAYQLFRQMGEKNIATWNAIICGLALHHGKFALTLFRELLQLENGGGSGNGSRKNNPNDVTMVGVLSGCCHAGLVEIGTQIFHSMERLHGIRPKLEHYSCMVDLFGKTGKLEEAEELIQSMRWKADVAVLGALLSACRKYKNVEIGERMARRILKLEPCNHGVYVVLSNIYAESGRWDDVLRLRKVMKGGGLKKIPGWSCEVN